MVFSLLPSPGITITDVLLRAICGKHTGARITCNTHGICIIMVHVALVFFCSYNIFCHCSSGTIWKDSFTCNNLASYVISPHYMSHNHTILPCTSLLYRIPPHPSQTCKIILSASQDLESHACTIRSCFARDITSCKIFCRCCSNRSC